LRPSSIAKQGKLVVRSNAGKEKKVPGTYRATFLDDRPTNLYNLRVLAPMESGCGSKKYAGVAKW
jgi:hypothetical protein